MPLFHAELCDNIKSYQLGETMIKPKTNPKFVYDEEGKKTGVLITVKDFELLIDTLEDLYDYEFIKSRENIGLKDEKLIPIEEIESRISGK